MSIQTEALLVLVCIGGIWLWMKVGKYVMQLLGVLLLIVLMLAFAFVHTYQAFSEKTLVATITARPVANKAHMMIVTLQRAGSATSETYELSGDRWMLQCGVIEVQPWLTWLGIKSGYSLTRIDSEFDDPNHATAKPISLGGFSLASTTDAWMYFPLIRSSYSSAVIENADGRQYIVSVDSSGDLTARRA